LQSAKRQEVAEIVEALEALNPLQQPTQHLDQLAGKWVLLYTTITITVSATEPVCIKCGGSVCSMHAVVGVQQLAAR
jgi:hypothetical protein